MSELHYSVDFNKLNDDDDDYYYYYNAADERT